MLRELKQYVFVSAVVSLTPTSRRVSLWPKSDSEGYSYEDLARSTQAGNVAAYSTPSTTQTIHNTFQQTTTQHNGKESLTH